MADKLNIPKYVIADGDEGVQFNDGVRLAVAGAGYKLTGFAEIAKALKKLFKTDVYSVATENSAWMKKKLDLNDWEQVNAMAQQHIQAVSDKNKLKYAGYLPFADPQEIKYEIKGHMVRPKGLHLANKICFTVGGGEQTYNLGQYLISADWVSEVPVDVAEAAIQEQVDFYQELAGKKLEFVVQEEGVLGEEKAAENKKVLQGMGIELK